MNGSSSSFSSGDPESQVAALQRQVSVLLLVSLVMSFTLAAYFYYQSHIWNKDAAAIQQQANEIITTSKTVSAHIDRVAVTNFIAQINVYAQKNPEFAQQVMKKYGFTAPTTAPVKR